MPSASLHPYIEFSTGRAILKGGWSTCPLRCGLVLLMAVIKVILGTLLSTQQMRLLQLCGIDLY